MAINIRHMRRSATQFAIRQALTLTAVLPIEGQRSAVRFAVMQAARIPILRRWLRENIREALGQEFSAVAVRAYFHHVAWFLSNAVATFNAGVMATPVPDEVKFDDSIHVLDAAVAERRGVVIASPHWSGHELVAAVVNRRHPMAMLVRQAAASEQMARKLKWYKATGADIVLRPVGASAIKDAVAYLNVLKSGKILAITPDLLADPGDGVEAKIFGRVARLHGGAFALAIMAKAPIIRASFRWESDKRLVVIFDRAPSDAYPGGRDVAIQTAVQDWCIWFEEKLRAAPENWLFWLDKRWSRFLREAPRVSPNP